MRLLRNSFALFVAVFWLLATQHCALEAAGILAQGCEEVTGEHDCGGSEHAADGCALVETGLYKSNGTTLTVTAPSLVPLGECLLWVGDADLELAATTEVAVIAIERPLNWVPTWRFVRRAALSPRAPSLMVA